MDMNHNQTDLLPIVIEGHTFKPNAEGLWSLNEIHQTLSLDPTKEPSEWRNEIQTELSNSGNLRSKAGRYGGTLATESGAIAYAMWVSTGFYLMVVDAFVAMRNSALSELRHKDALLDANMPKASTLDMKARGAGLTWTEACRVAGIQQPRLALDALVSVGVFVYPVDNFGTREGSPRPPKSGFEAGAFVKVSSDFGNREGWRVKPGGLDWLRSKTEKINLKVAEEKARKDKAQRDAKARLKENLKASSPDF
ncbi:KilA-N domain-containing protein|uniref:KilA-N domain-containing protein n=1 Tax=Pseudomonas sp. SbOxS1 TaxID=2723884 RepID=UPI0015D0E663|nr:KilA-N domain-containing protein [Pseudomonas sp. SbOxS1]NYU02641.1 KilA-N domain-containing protein [Pseudomonas sp. SbOxS1]